MNTVTPCILKTYVRKNGEVPIYARMYINRTRLLLPVNVNVLLSDWDDQRKQVRISDPEYRFKNLQVRNAIARITEIQKRYRLQYKELTAELMRDEYKIFSTNVDFYEFMQRAIDARRSSSSNATYIKHTQVLTKLREFRESLSFSQINSEWVEEFERWLRVSKKNQKNTRVGNLKILKQYLSLAVKRDIIERNPIDTGFSRQQTDRIYCTRQEVDRIISLYRKSDEYSNLTEVLRLFIFSCQTGIRISDIFLIRHEDIHDQVLSFVPQKTSYAKSNSVYIPLTALAREMIHDAAPLRAVGPVFDRRSNPYVNRVLKVIANKAGIKKNLTFHSGRHTFATLFLESGGSVEVLQKILGHSNISQTMIYVHVSKQRITDQMRNFNNQYK